MNQNAVKRYHLYANRRKIALKAWARKHEIYRSLYRFLGIIGESNNLPKLDQCMEMTLEYLQHAR